MQTGTAHSHLKTLAFSILEFYDITDLELALEAADYYNYLAGKDADESIIPASFRTACDKYEMLVEVKHGSWPNYIHNEVV